MPAAIYYLLSEEADNATDAVNSFLSLIAFRLEDEPTVIARVGPIIREGILKMLENFERFGFGGEVYGDAYGDVVGRYCDLPRS